METSRWADIYKHLKSKGFDVYEPARHTGECVSKYIVLKVLGFDRVNNLSSISQQYDVLMYVPKDEYSELEPFVDSVRQAMKELEPMIMPLHSMTPPFYDDSVKGHMVSMQYRNSRKI